MNQYERPIYSRPTVDFLEAIPTNGCSATVNLPLPSREANWFIRAIGITSLEDLAYEVQVFNSATNLGGTFATDHFVGAWQFPTKVVGPPATVGWPVTPVGGSADPYYHFYIDGNLIPYTDLDQMQAASQPSGGTYPSNANLHCRLVNRSAASKTAGAPGALQVIFYLTLQGQQPI